jgi:hypothetical protein
MTASTTVPDEADNLTLRYLRTMRRDITVVLENQARDRTLITRLAARMDQSVGEIRRDISDLRSDVVLLENGLLNRHNEILSIIRRIDDLDAVLPGDGDLP